MSLNTPPWQAVTCGQMINTVGSSGNALNPHLHVEVRLGLAQICLGSMVHYDASATQDEMATYCLWRISGAAMARSAKVATSSTTPIAPPRPQLSRLSTWFCTSVESMVLRGPPSRAGVM